MRLLWRAPIWLYRLGLGWLLGKRFLLLRHTGRKSGLGRQAVLEVVRYDSEEERFIIASGFGEQSDWLLNVSKTPQVRIQVGGRQYAALARRLSVAEAELEMADYGRRHPRAIKTLGGILGYEVGNTEETYREFGRIIPIVALDVQQ